MVESVLSDRVQKLVDEQQRIIANCDGNITYYQGVIAVEQQRKEAALKLLAEVKGLQLEKAWVVEEPIV